jgi:hypothetical protein
MACRHLQHISSKQMSCKILIFDKFFYQFNCEVDRWNLFFNCGDQRFRNLKARILSDYLVVNTQIWNRPSCTVPRIILAIETDRIGQFKMHLIESKYNVQYYLWLSKQREVHPGRCKRDPWFYQGVTAWAVMVLLLAGFVATSWIANTYLLKSQWYH